MTTNSQRRVVHLEDCTNAFVTTKSLMNTTRIWSYRAVALATLLYGSETWVTYRSHIRLLEGFHQHCLRTTLNIHCGDFVTNVEILEQPDIPSIEAMLLKYLTHGQYIPPKWRTIVYQRLPCVETIHRPHRERNPEETLHSLSQNVLHRMSC